MKKLLLILTLFFLSVPSYSYSAEITDEAQALYQAHQKSVYQIQVIDLATGKKTTIGSGFQFSDQGHIATNYHVVSNIIHWPERFRLEYVRHDGEIGELDVLHIDVIHDLAIVHSKDSYEFFLGFADSNLEKGTRIFSMGNPYDLGMTIIEGTYNGLMENSLYRKILFSGSINSGMSGGPSINRDGKVIGINVSTAGNQVSFLVPVEYLKESYQYIVQREGQAPSDWYKVIDEQLNANQTQYIDKLLASDWEVMPVGELTVPGEILNVFKCWGNSTDIEDKVFDYAYISCSSDDNLFISDSLITGKIIYKYNWVTSLKMWPIRYYNLYSSYFAYPHAYDNAGEEDVTNFQCHSDFVNIDGTSWKVVYCVREYKKYENLYDINLSIASVSEKDKGLLAELVVLGINQQRANLFATKFLKTIQWQK